MSLQKTNYRNSKAVFLLICHVVYVMDKRLYFPYFRHRNYFPTITIKIMTKQILISILLVNLIGHTFCYWRSRERNIKLPFHICAGLLCYRNYFPTITIKIMTKQNLKKILLGNPIGRTFYSWRTREL